MKKSVLLMCLAIIACTTSVLFNSCTPVIYSTTGQNVPLFREKGEVALNGSLGIVDEAEGVAAQGAVAVTNNFALGGSFYSLWGGKLDDDNWKANGNYFEVVAGRFGSFVKKDPQFIYEAFAGFGYGAINNKNSEASAVNVKFIKPFIQPSLGYRHKIVEIAATPRVSLLHYTSQDIRLSDPADNEEAKAFFGDKKTRLLFEPGVTFRIGYKNIKFQWQYNFTTFDGDYEEGSVNFSGIRDQFMSVGIHYNFGRNWAR